ncbi:hypothetical protein GCM10012275_16600 [Longimycelium tulufanense]|uniref:Lysophospholipase n=1 Tax=Longimycelium tulufanense TaxID=907463 RepID=A0A8J3CC83_9PSEU|nr:lysophospholipase [Longimycelium tulufanense]GGM46259.1 hypothetical protein GCM10012275_16600 [Longimycelium tulufanense]
MPTTTAPVKVASWNEPAGTATRGTLVLLPGRGEQPSLYERFGQRLASDGYRVRALGDATADLDATLAGVQQLFSADAEPSPRILVGSDTGALLALRLQAHGIVRADAVVVAGLPNVRRAALTPLGWEEELRARTSCPVYRTWLTDTGQLRRGVLTADRIPVSLREPVDLSAVTAPVLGLHGSADAVSPLAAVRSEFARLDTVQLVAVTEGKHDILNDVAHRSVAATIVLFLETLRNGPDAPKITRPVDLGIERGLLRNHSGTESVIGNGHIAMG